MKLQDHKKKKNSPLPPNMQKITKEEKKSFISKVLFLQFLFSSFLSFVHTASISFTFMNFYVCKTCFSFRVHILQKQMSVRIGEINSCLCGAPCRRWWKLQVRTSGSWQLRWLQHSSTRTSQSPSSELLKPEPGSGPLWCGWLTPSRVRLWTRFSWSRTRPLSGKCGGI